ncbi:HAD family hydrolase [Sphingomonas limnosediminicola]|jgi:HAD superfamily hydrolase (TIGR01509 family)|uniref:HAD family hydrolase n=1 Tax=Sphingomonas limnosediminicola TaxID=940133 RepID=A0ABP7LEG4_9SPHN
MPRPDGLIFDFDGVLLESEFERNRELAALLTDLGHRHSVEETLHHYTGLAGNDFLAAIERRIGTQLPPEFHDRLRDKSRRALREGIMAVLGAVDFVQSLPAEMPRAVASSSSTKWIRGHLAHLGLTEAFGEHVYSGHEHVERGKPEPDIYLHTARQIGVSIEHCAILEDSRVGVTGALASGARVIGLAAGSHCLDGHDEMLRALGVREIAYSFDDVRRLLSLG